MKYLIGIDFSIAKPAACVYDGKNYKFYSWVKNLSDKLILLYQDAGVNISRRDNIDLDDLVHDDLVNSNILSDLIIKDLKPYINSETVFIFEGSSFASRGNQLISLTAWRYIFMQRLYAMNVDINSMYTYAPISIKKTAGCSKKGMGKAEMIEAFISTTIDSQFKNCLTADRERFKKKTGTWIDHLDDLVDAYWAVETFLEKNPKERHILQE
jgi:hypothetical protein